MHFSDGASPPPEIIEQWCDLIRATFDAKIAAGAERPTIAVHCVAGLGRAPVLVAIALIEYGMDAISAVTFIREKRRGAINAVQLAYLEGYKRRKPKGKCVIM
jgi:protein tyrosine phosphatase type IVA